MTIPTGTMVPLSTEQGNFRVEILKHSIGHHNLEAITFLFTYERFIHAEVMTHRWSRNYSSSRAIPYEKMKKWVAQDPALPLHLGSNRPGMQAGNEVENTEKLKSDLLSFYCSVAEHCDFIDTEHNPHKEIINRYTEPWGWITGVATMGRSQLMNFFQLRISPMAHPNIQRLAVAMARLYRASKPQILEPSQWHIPFVDSVEGTHEDLVWSVARCAWTSYNNPTKDSTFDKALRRHDDCVNFKHATPLEHQLQCRGDRGKSGLVPGYDSYRMMVPGESASDFDFSVLDTDYQDKWFCVKG